MGILFPHRIERLKDLPAKSLKPEEVGDIRQWLYKRPQSWKKVAVFLHQKIIWHLFSKNLQKIFFPQNVINNIDSFLSEFCLGNLRFFSKKNKKFISPLFFCLLCLVYYYVWQVNYSFYKCWLYFMKLFFYCALKWKLPLPAYGNTKKIKWRKTHCKNIYCTILMLKGK